MSFWDHLEELRGVLLRSIVAVCIGAVCVFCFKKFVFDSVILAPSRGDFFLYRWLGIPFSMDIVNIDLSAQFFVHLRVSAAIGFILAFPYICLQVWKFVSPALYEREKAAVRKVFLWASLLFYAGVAVGYVLVFPITLNFFQDYSVSSSVRNTISLQSYISMFNSMVLLMGVVFEFPAAIAVASSLGLVSREGLRKYRRHAIVAILVVSAIITPADPFSMIVCAMPLYLLYEASIMVCARTEKREDGLQKASSADNES